MKFHYLIAQAGKEKQHKKENPTYHSANSVASGRGKGMVRICCVHPAITEEREKRYIKIKKREKKKSLQGGRETSCLTTGNGGSCMPFYTHVCIHAHTRRQPLFEEILWACCHASYEMGQRTACEEECGRSHELHL